MKTVHFYNTNS